MELHTIALQMTESWQKVKGKQIPWHHFEILLLFFLPKIHVFSVHKSGTDSLCMTLLGINCLIDRRHCDPQAGSRACHSCLWMVHERVRHVGSRLRAEVEGRSFFVFFFCLYAGVPTGVRCGRGVGLAVLHCSGCGVCRIYSSLGGIQVGLFLKLADIFLVPDPFVAKPVGYLCGRAEGGGAEESDVKQPQHRALRSVIVSRCHVWVHQVPNSQPLQ